MDENIKTFSEGIQGHVKSYDESLNKESLDLFGASSVQRRRMYGQYMLRATGKGLDEGYQRIKNNLGINQAGVDDITNLFFSNRPITDKQKEILKTGWPKIFGKI